MNVERCQNNDIIEHTALLGKLDWLVSSKLRYTLTHRLMYCSINKVTVA